MSLWLWFVGCKMPFMSGFGSPTKVSFLGISFDATFQPQPGPQPYWVQSAHPRERLAAADLAESRRVGVREGKPPRGLTEDRPSAHCAGHLAPGDSLTGTQGADGTPSLLGQLVGLGRSPEPEALRQGLEAFGWLVCVLGVAQGRKGHLGWGGVGRISFLSLALNIHLLS